jgi:ornithine--oxo-acid transaminase
MIGLEFGAPHSFALKTAWHLLETANKGLFCQMVLIPLFRDHQILCQVSGPNIHVIKLLPPLVIDEIDRIWICDAFDAVIADCHRVPGAVWDLGRTLAGHSMRSRARAG